MSQFWSRRRPFPDDVELDAGAGFVGLVLVPGQDGLLVARKEQALAGVAPTEYGYGAAHPDAETTFAFARLVGGMGERVQSSGTSTRYRYADGVDCSIAGMPRLGPAFTAEALPAAAGEVRQFLAVHDQLASAILPIALSVPTAFCLVGTSVYHRVAGAWVLSKNFGAANTVNVGVVFKGATGNGGLWVATALDEIWQYTPAGTWTQATLPAGMTARYLAVVGDELYAGGGSELRVATDDPLLAASWGGAILVQVGQQQADVTGLASVAGQLFVLKEDGVYTVTTTGTGVEVADVFPEFRPLRAPTNGRAAAVWDDALWATYGDTFQRIDGGSSATRTPIGPERLVENDSPVRGPVVASTGWGDWFLYAAVYDEAAGTSYLLKYGTWAPGTDGAGYRFADAWHGAIASWPGRRVTRLDVVHLDLTARDGGEPNPALWVGFADGGVAYARLPAGSPDPTSDPACRFVPTGRLYWPLHHAMYEADAKAFHGFSAFGPVLDAGRYARQVYRVDQAAVYADAGGAFTATGQRVDLPDSVTGALIDAATDLYTTDATTTPVLEGLALHEARRPSLRLEWSFSVDAGNRIVRRDGTASRRTAAQVRALLRAAARTPGRVRMRLPDEEVGSFQAVAYGETVAAVDGRDGLEWTIPVTLIQFR